MKPLYVKGGETRIDQDGPALKVGHPRRADCWYPIARLSRVISATRVQWSSEALLACAAAGVSVCFLDDDGRLVARLVGRPGEREEIRQRLADFQLQPDWAEVYGLWLSGMEQMALRSLARRVGLDLTHRQSPAQLRQRLREQAARLQVLASYERAGGQLEALVVGLVTQSLSEAGVAVDFAGWAHLPLAADLGRILIWDYQLTLLGWLADRQQQGLGLPPDDVALVTFFEQRSARSNELCRRLINRLHHWLIEQSSWR